MFRRTKVSYKKPNTAPQRLPPSDDRCLKSQTKVRTQYCMCHKDIATRRYGIKVYRGNTVYITGPSACHKYICICNCILRVRGSRAMGAVLMCGSHWAVAWFMGRVYNINIYVMHTHPSRQLDAQCRTSSAPLRDLLDAPTALAACCGFESNRLTCVTRIFCICICIFSIDFHMACFATTVTVPRTGVVRTRAKRTTGKQGLRYTRLGQRHHTIIPP
jgi:hypothetical protein